VPRLSLNFRFLIAMLCVAVLIMRIGGAHLHVCFDGSEPPVAMHLGDSGVHHAQEPAHGNPAGEPHSDQDVGIGADALVKKPSGSLEIPLLALLSGLLLFYVARRRDVLPPFSSPLQLSPIRAHLRPPLRGPPTSR
jgi:hypothetical protein